MVFDDRGQGIIQSSGCLDDAGLLAREMHWASRFLESVIYEDGGNIMTAYNYCCCNT